MNYQIPDENLKVNISIGEPDVCFYDVRKPPFEVYGLYDYKNQSEFRRMPKEASLRVHDFIEQLAKNTAGGHIRFCTDSEYIAIKAVMPEMGRLSHMAFIGSAGFDLCIDSPDTGFSRYMKPFVPDINAKDGYEAKIKLPSRKLRYFTVCFPSYSSVKNLYIGLHMIDYIAKLDMSTLSLF